MRELHLFLPGLAVFYFLIKELKLMVLLFVEILPLASAYLLIVLCVLMFVLHLFVL